MTPLPPPDELKDTVRRFILQTSLAGEPEDTLRNDTPLQTSGILDSLATLGLIAFVHQTFEVELDMHDTSLERFDSVNDIALAIERKRARSVPALP